MKNFVSKTTYKRSVTIKDYDTNIKGISITVPKGSIVENKTAIGYDDDYRFWVSWKDQVEKMTGFKNSMLAHDLTYYGINVPAEYCEPYKKD